MSAIHQALACLRARKGRLATSLLIALLFLGGWLVLSGWSSRAAEPQRQNAQSAEPVGAVDDEDLLKAGTNDSNWLMYGRTYNAQRYSSLKQINTGNVARLAPLWTFQTGVLDGFECSPLVIDGIMYLT
ncbi:MAG TPA: hypothetical protein VGZ22_23515, partial [Isosphaeraceae bacterium]|nr:hypothetical protein [Isosphaeraceae bacterium]